MRIIRIERCYNCQYRDSIFGYDTGEKRAVWLCGKKDRITIPNVMGEPPEWCPLEYIDKEKLPPEPSGTIAERLNRL